MNATATVQTDCSKCRRFHDPKVTACSPPPETVTLPTTRFVVPAEAAALTVKVTGEMSTSCGEAFTAEVRNGRTLIGVIENDGRGGGTWFQPSSNTDRTFFDHLAEEYAAIDEEHRFVAHESLCNDLFEEAATTRTLNRKRAATFRKVGGDPLEYYSFRGVKPGEVPDATWRKVVADFGGAAVEQWVKGTGWVTVEVQS